MTAIKNPVSNQFCKPVYLENGDLRKALIKEVAIKTLKELGVCLACAGVTLLFVSSISVGQGLLVAAVSIVAFNMIVRLVQAACIYGSHQFRKEENGENKAKILDAISRALNFICPLNFSQFYEGTASTLVHEVGHATAASLLFKNSHPRIQVFPFQGGVTKYMPQELSTIGKHVGLKNAFLITAAAGAGFTVLSSIAMIASAHFLKKNHPETARYLHMCAAFAIFNECLYALSSFFMSSPGHDFAALRMIGGINPLTCVATMIAVPLLVKTALFAIDFIRNKINQSQPFASHKVLALKTV